ncbi:methylmalonyl-CoA epimerase [Myxococcota bacterium]|nr:methylmalonyl-CoA epimerase [Myxococcota bacterium]
MIKRIHHIGIAVADLDAAARVFGEAVGLPDGGREDVPSAQTRVHFFPVGESRFELLRPLAEDSPVGRFLEKRGPGLHHVCLEVDDVEAEARRMREAGVEFLTEAPVPGAHGARVIFVHPRSTGGLLLELSEFPATGEDAK